MLFRITRADDIRPYIHNVQQSRGAERPLRERSHSSRREAMRVRAQPAAAHKKAGSARSHIRTSLHLFILVRTRPNASRNFL